MLSLMKLSEQNYPQIRKMLEEWFKVESDITPAAIAKGDYRHYDSYKDEIESLEHRNGLVPDVTYFCYDDELQEFIGAVNIRLTLSNYLYNYGGHVGDGLAPKHRGKGLGYELVRLAIEKCKEHGIKRPLFVCDKKNVASAKTIERNGGIFENEIELDGKVMQRYWVGREDRNHFVAVSGFVTNEKGQVLLVETPMRGWEFPGGCVDSHECLEEAVIREIFEESNAQTCVKRLLSVTKNLQSDTVTLDYHCEYITGELKPSIETISAVWVDIEQAMEMISEPSYLKRFKLMVSNHDVVKYLAFNKIPFKSIKEREY